MRQPQVLAALALAIALSAQTEFPTRSGPPPAPTPRQLARKLLDGVVESASQARPGMQAVVMLHVADNYREFDRKQALEYFRQAFADTAQVPSLVDADDRSELQGNVVELVADLDADVALEMLAQIAPAGKEDPRVAAIEKIVHALVEKSRLDDALKLLDGPGAATASFPYAGMKMVLAKLAGDDPRVLAGFGTAMAAFANRPNLAFEDLLIANWKRLPKAMARSAAGSLLKWIMDRPGGASQEAHISGASGAVTLRSRQEFELFDLMEMLRELEPQTAEGILQKLPGLRDALDRYPAGKRSMGSMVGMTLYMGGSPGVEAEADSIALSRAYAVIQTAKEDPEKAAGMLNQLAKDLPDSARVPYAVVGFVQSVSEEYPDEAAKAIESAAKMLDAMDAERSAPNWTALIEVAHRAHDDELARRLVSKGFEACGELAKRENNADNPNTFLPEYWMSTHYYREIVAAAAKALGASTEPLLKEIADQDIALLARIELAQALLVRGPTRTKIGRRLKKRTTIGG